MSENVNLPAEDPGAARPGAKVQAWLQNLLGLGLLVVVAVNVGNAGSRYLFGVSPVGADELMVFLVIWVVMIGAVLSFFLRTHISVNLLPLYLKGRARLALYLVHDAAAVLACGYATWASWLFIGRIASIGVTSMGLGVPMTVPHAALLCGFAGLTLGGVVMFALDLVRLLRNDPGSEAGA